MGCSRVVEPVEAGKGSFVAIAAAAAAVAVVVELGELSWLGISSRTKRSFSLVGLFG